MDFYQYVSIKMPNFETIFTTKEIAQLRELYDDYLFCYRMKDNIIKVKNGDVESAKRKLDAKIDAIMESHMQVFSKKTSVK